MPQQPTPAKSVILLGSLMGGPWYSGLGVCRVLLGNEESLLQVDLTMTAQPPRPVTPDEGRAGGLKGVRHVIAVSSCKGGMAR